MTKWIGLTEAIVASSAGKSIISEADTEGVRHLYHPKLLNAKPLGTHSAVFNSGVIPRELHKGRWEVVN